MDIGKLSTLSKTEAFALDGTCALVSVRSLERMAYVQLLIPACSLDIQQIRAERARQLGHSPRRSTRFAGLHSSIPLLPERSRSLAGIHILLLRPLHVYYRVPTLSFPPPRTISWAGSRQGLKVLGRMGDKYRKDPPDHPPPAPAVWAVRAHWAERTVHRG